MSEAVAPREKSGIPAWLIDTRVISSFIAAILVVAALFVGVTPTNSVIPDRSALPGEVNSLIGNVTGAAKPELGYPRIRVTRVGIDLLLVKGDGKAPPVKYEAFTYPGTDHLLTTGQVGGGNTYVYAHARTHMFWELHDMHIGDIVAIDYGGGKVLKYRVSEVHPRVDWRDMKWLGQTADDRLTLQTCNGWRDDDPRFVVVAHRVPDSTPENA